MKVFKNTRARLLALIGMLCIGFASLVVADIKDYEFQLVQNEIKTGEGTVSVRLLNKKTGEPVSGAVIFANRIDMAPDGMAMMAAPIEALPATEPGIYRFKTKLSMAGNWQLSLAAKVQGEEGTVESKLVLKALP